MTMFTFTSHRTHQIHLQVNPFLIVLIYEVNEIERKHTLFIYLIIIIKNEVSNIISQLIISKKKIK